MSQKRIYVDFHVLQTVPPSCVNRDDTGSPKTALYGGVNRARVSSQAWKRAMRLDFEDIFPKESLSLRTKRIVRLVAEELTNLGYTENAEEAAAQLIKNAGVSLDKDNNSKAMFFMSRAQAEALALLGLESPDVLGAKVTKEHKKALADALCNAPGVDIALFGRMVADDPSYNTDACAQVAHAISTHRVQNEFDYFTAVDDIPLDDNAGAAHIGTTEFNSSTLYRYATVAVHQLSGLLGDDTADAVAGFARAFTTSMPTGKQNSFANRTLPDALMITVRMDQPLNLVGAFEKPVFAGEGGYAERSGKALAAHARQLYQSFATAPKTTYIVGSSLSELGEGQPLEQVLTLLKEEMAQLTGGKTV